MQGIKPINDNYYSTVNIKNKQTKVNKDFSSFLGETKSLDDIFLKASKEYNVDVNLLKAIGKAESNFKTDAVSRSGAQGVMQLMPATAKYLGVVDSFDPEQNIMGGAKYISQMMDKYDNDVNLALAAYNAGSNNVKKYGGVPPFKETQNYIKKISGFLGQDLDANIPVKTRINPMAKEANEIKSGQEKVLRIFDYREFNYDDYLKFIDIFLKDDKDESKDKKDGFSKPMININQAMSLLNIMKKV